MVVLCWPAEKPVSPTAICKLITFTWSLSTCYCHSAGTQPLSSPLADAFLSLSSLPRTGKSSCVLEPACAAGVLFGAQKNLFEV